MSKPEFRLGPFIRGEEIGADLLRNVNNKCFDDFLDLIRRFLPLIPGKPDEPTEPTEPVVPIGVQAVGAPNLWAQNIDGTGVIVGVIDTGIMNHPDLDDKVVLRKNYTIEFFKPRAEHGTHVAGTIAANGSIKGVAPGAQLAEYRVLNSLGAGSNQNIIRAIRDAADDGCHVINLSLGGPQDDPELEASINYAYNKGVVIIAAAGNEGDGSDETDEVSYPAIYDNVYSVGSVNYENNMEPSHFTNTSKYVDCCSHGERVLSTGPNSRYVELTGTSMASPHVAGVAALLISQKLAAGESYKPLDIYQALTDHAIDIHTPGRDNATGNGFVTLDK